MEIYVARGTEKTGPFSLEEVQCRLEARSLSPSDLAWYMGIKEWIPLSQVPGLKMPEQGAPPRSSGPPPLPASGPPPMPASPWTPVVSPAPAHSHSPAPPPRTGLLIASGVTVILVAMVMFGTAITWLSESGRNDVRSALAFPMLLLSIAFGVGSIQFFLALRRNPTGHCQVCGEFKPTIFGSLNRHIGAVILMFHGHITGHMCKDCISDTFWKFTLTTFAVGWWGIISFFITPVVLVNNIAYYLRSRFM